MEFCRLQFNLKLLSEQIAHPFSKFEKFTSSEFVNMNLAIFFVCID